MSGKDFKATPHPVDDTKEFKGLFKIEKMFKGLKTV